MGRRPGRQWPVPAAAACPDPRATGRTPPARRQRRQVLHPRLQQRRRAAAEARRRAPQSTARAASRPRG
eukprot:8010520-Alexandrium_andersonii.AAC.1